MKIEYFNRIEYRNDEGQLHREDGPAIDYSNGDKSWYLNGGFHREDGPAYVTDKVSEWWYYNNLHRLDGPAVEYADGGKEWWVWGRYHRMSGPAIDYGGYKCWYIDGKYHREDGPAIEWGSGIREWYLNGDFSVEDEFIESLTNQEPNPNLFKDLSLEDLEELSADLCDKYDGKIKQWCNFYAIYFKEKIDPNDPDLKSFENRIKDFRIKVGLKSILVY